MQNGNESNEKSGTTKQRRFDMLENHEKKLGHNVLQSVLENDITYQERIKEITNKNTVGNIKQDEIEKQTKKAYTSAVIRSQYRVEHGKGTDTDQKFASFLDIAIKRGAISAYVNVENEAKKVRNSNNDERRGK